MSKDNRNTNIDMQNKMNITHPEFVQTVLGAVDTANIGFCQCHEHLFIEKGKPFEINKSLYMDDFDRSVCELELYKKCGGNLIVDAQPVGCGRMEENLKEASLATGVHIIATTGFHKLVFYPENHWIFKYNTSHLTGLFIKEINCGMVLNANTNEPAKSTDSKAGLLKVALDTCGITGDYEKLYQAVADAARETGAPIMLHTEKGADAIEALNYFTQKSIPANSLIFCHLDRSESNAGIHKEIADSGAFLEYDTIGRFKYHSDEEEVRILADITDSGFENNILLGFDSTRERLKSYGGSMGLDYIKTVFIPGLLKYGFKKETIDKYTIYNPQKALSFKKSILFN